MSKTKKQKFHKFIGILGNILFIPFFIIILFSSVMMFIAKNNNEVPSIFGYSAVKILSNSMEPEFRVGDVVLVKQVDPATLKVGDVIAFYSYMEDSVDPNTDLERLSQQLENSYNISANLSSNVSIAKTYEHKKVAPYSKVVFHRIKAITKNRNASDDNYNKLFFETKGDRNSTADDKYIMEDYVVGVLAGHNNVVATLLTFCTSTVGTIMFIIVPSLLLIIILSLKFSGDYKVFKNEKLLEEQRHIETQSVIEKSLQDPVSEVKTTSSRIAIDKNNEIKTDLDVERKSQKAEQKMVSQPEQKTSKVPVSAKPSTTQVAGNISKPPPAPPKAPPVPPKAPPKK